MEPRIGMLQSRESETTPSSVQESGSPMVPGRKEALEKRTIGTAACEALNKPLAFVSVE